MSYSASKIECLRFAGRNGGEGIGCCAIDIFQGFVNEPDGKAAVQLFHGDSETPLVLGRGEAWLGPTNRDIFQNYLRIGTFDLQEMPNRAFLVALTEEQLARGAGVGRKWLEILKEEGFEFIRTFDNSVYSGQALDDPDGDGRVWIDPGCSCCDGYWDDGDNGEGSHPIHLFGLFRNIGANKIDDPFTPPKCWTDLPEPSMTHLERWKSRELKILTKEEATGKTEVVAAAESPATNGPW